MNHIPPFPLVYFILIQFASIANAWAAPGPCKTIQLNDIYICPTETMIADAEFLYIKTIDEQKSALYAGKLRQNVLSESYLFDTPEGWAIGQHSISPNLKIVLMTMSRKDCHVGWPRKDGESCSWGRNVLFAGIPSYNTTLGTYYVLVNLASLYGRNSDIAGWHTWLTPDKVLFNARIVADDITIDDKQNGFAYVLTFNYNETGINGLSISLWGGTKINSENCYIGRMHASVPTHGYRKSCSAGQYVTFARRCYDEPRTSDNFSWYNTPNYDGQAGCAVHKKSFHDN
jgi:hypothetical protein